MKRNIVIAAVLLSLLAAEASAQSALERLEARIRAQRERRAPAAPLEPALVDPAPPPGNQPAAGSGFLGLVAEDILPLGPGVRVLEVFEGGPADQAGLKVGDLIMGVDDHGIQRMAALAEILAKVPPGGKVTLEILRGDQQWQIEVSLGRLPARQRRPEGILDRFLPGRVREPADNGAEAAQPLLAPPRLAVPPVSDLERIERLETQIVELEQRLRRLEQLMIEQLLQEKP